jgi:hypothetical protein
MKLTGNIPAKDAARKLMLLGASFTKAALIQVHDKLMANGKAARNCRYPDE